jgi:transketolase
VSLTITDKNHLTLKALNIKERFIKMYYNANAGHVGSSLSCAEILTFLYFGLMAENDEIILSKGHAAAALYSLLAEAAVLSEEEIATFYKDGTYLAAHPPANKIAKIPFATGSLGHGLGLSAGMGLASKLKKSGKTIYCITSDGELNEGSIWEAAMFISHHHLQNVVWLIDRNNLQGFGKTEDVISLKDLDKKLSAFGFNVLTVSGHNFEELNSIANFKSESQVPVAVICNTIKGNGWCKHENTIDCHYLPMNEDDYLEMLNSIKAEKTALNSPNDYEK